MKKILLLTIVITMLIAARVVSANGTGIECTSTVQGEQVYITGKVPGVSQEHLVGLLIGDISNIIYVDQTECDETGNFSFKFVLPDSLPPGEYDVGVGTSADAETYHGTLVYVPTVEREFFDADIKVSLANYVPIITGNMNCGEGKTIEITVVDKSNNTIVVEDLIASANNKQTLSYTLPSIVTGKDYKLTISCKEGDKTVFNINVDVDSVVLLLSVSGDVEVADNIKLDINSKTSNSDFIDRSISVIKKSEFSFTIPNLVSNISCDINTHGYEWVPISEIDPSPEPTPDPTPGDETDQSNKTEYYVNGNIGSIDRVMIYVNNIQRLQEKIVTVNYNNSALELIDTCSFTHSKEVATGIIEGTYIEILLVADGKIRFRINKDFSDNTMISGAINVMTFKKLTNNAVSITATIENDSEIH